MPQGIIARCVMVHLVVVLCEPPPPLSLHVGFRVGTNAWMVVAHKGSECDAVPIPGCAMWGFSQTSTPEEEHTDPLLPSSRSCFGECCDVFLDIVGEKVCSPTTGNGGQASGVCTGVLPTDPAYTPPPSCPLGEL